MKKFLLVAISICFSFVIKAQAVKNDTPKLLNAEAINTNTEKGENTTNNSTLKLSETNGNNINDTLNRQLQNSLQNKNDSMFFEEKSIKNK